MIGLSGLGHMGVKFAKALGACAVMVTISPEKGGNVLRLGADEVLVSNGVGTMANRQARFGFLLDTTPVSHDVDSYLIPLKLDGTTAMVGVLAPLAPIVGGNLIAGRRSIAGSAIGGMPETQEIPHPPWGLSNSSGRCIAGRQAQPGRISCASVFEPHSGARRRRP